MQRLFMPAASLCKQKYQSYKSIGSLC